MDLLAIIGEFELDGRMIDDRAFSLDPDSQCAKFSCQSCVPLFIPIAY